MPANDLMLCIDIGAGSIKAAEYSYTSGQEMRLERFAYAEYLTNAVEAGVEIDTESDSKLDLLQTLIKVVKDNSFESKNISLSLSGQDAYIRFVKVPSMVHDEKKIRQIIEFEAQSAIPFDLKEVVWDSQLLNAQDENGEIEAMLVIVKGDEIEQITSVLEGLGKKVSLIEISPTACYNAARLNGVGNDQCELILNIGERSSTLLFIDGAHLFVRIIPIAGHAITLQISKEFGISFHEAEEMKRRHGFVALGGAYEEPDSEVASTVSKIVRNVMTRLHGEISRSINIYRSQQKGRKPEKLYLSGGSSVMEYTLRFFSEKLRIPVEYLNPLRSVAIGEQVNKEELADVAHVFSETVGLALRKAMVCPMEITLITSSMKRLLDFRSKLAYCYASAATLLLCLLVTFFGLAKQEVIAKDKRDIVMEPLKNTKAIIKKLEAAESHFNNAQSDYNTAAAFLEERKMWPRLLNEVEQVLPKDVWVTNFNLSTVDPMNAVNKSEQKADGGGLFGGMDERTAVVVKDYLSVRLEGYGLVRSEDFSERFTERLSKSNFFVFDSNKVGYDSIQDNIYTGSAFNIAHYVITVKMKDIVKQ